VFAILIVFPLRLQAAGISAESQEALLAGRWETVYETLKDVELEKADPICRTVAAHACLATNRNNRALLLFLSVAPDEHPLWRTWSGNLVKKHRENAIARYLHGDALARCGDPDGDNWFSKALESDPKLGLAWVGRGVVTRLGDRPDAGRIFDRQFWKLLADASDGASK